MLFLGGCDRETPPAAIDAGAAPLPSVARALGVDANEFEPGADPAAAAGDLKDDIERFASVDACVQERAKIDPVVGDAIESIGYDTLVRDACVVLDAAKARDAKKCESIAASGLRARCVATVAEIAGDADACPWEVGSRPARGRSAACVAIAARDARLCAAVVDAGERATCAAIVTKRADACSKLAVRAEQARCTRNADRWRTSIPDAAADAAAIAPPAGKLHVEGAGDAGAPLDVDLAADLARGVVVVQQRDGLRVVVGSLGDTGPGFVAPPPLARPAFGVEMFVRSSAAGAKSATMDRVELVLPGRAPLATPAAHSTLAAKIESIEASRGSSVQLTLDGDLGDPVSTWHLHVEATTFVRDVVRGTAAPMR